jgi:predicted nucleic acid-binding protein
MNYYFDTSALIKNYIEENGSNIVIELINNAKEIFVSELYLVESISTLRRILLDKLITEEDYENIKNEIKYDFEYFTKIEIEKILNDCENLIDKYQLKTLDSIQLASAIHIKNEIDYIVCCDKKLLKSAEEEKIKVINPNKDVI